MKRHWIIVRNDKSLETQDGEVFYSEQGAEKRARELAEDVPGAKYSVFALVSSFVVNVMTEERAQ